MSVQPVQLTAEDGAVSRGLFFRPEGGAARVGVHLMHPRADSSSSYVIRPLVAAGCAVLARSSRSPNNDTTVVQEQLLLDVAAGVTFLREAGCHHVILLGLSSGASLAAFYQAEVRASAGMRLRETPAGDVLDLNTFSMPAADAIISLCGHGGLGWVMSKLIDPSVIDERDPLSCDPTLDLYDPRNGFKKPPESSSYTPAFLKLYRAAQRERVMRIDLQARRWLAVGETARAAVQHSEQDMLKIERTAALQPAMIVYRTSADPAFVDLSIDPDNRQIGSYQSPRPDRDNYGTGGFARFTTPRAWLSTWSLFNSNALQERNLPRFRDPFLMVHGQADLSTRLSEATALFERSVSGDKRFHSVAALNHFGQIIKPDGTPTGPSSEACDLVIQWIRERFRI
jgi:pimeloyl-ACP methyl ester carboxylesterase